MIPPLSTGIIYAIARQPQECVAELRPWGYLTSVVPKDGLSLVNRWEVLFPISILQIRLLQVS